MNILHFADAHIGVTRFGTIDPRTGMNTRVQDFLRSLDQITGYAMEHDIDLILFAGDAFHKRNPRSEYQIAFAERIVEMARSCCPVVLLVGNHDTGSDLRASALGIYNMFAMNIEVGDSYKVLNIPLTCGPIQIATFPHPTRRMLGSRPAQVMQAVLRELEEATDEDMPSMLLAHLTVTDAKYGGYGVKAGIQAFQDETIVELLDLTGGPWSYVALGHLHMHQSLNSMGDPPVVYAGSIERIDFGEAKEKKGFCHITVDGPETSWKFVELNVRPMHLLEIDLMSRLNKDYADYAISVIEHYGEDVFEDAIVRVRMKIKDTDLVLVDQRRIEKALCCASHVSLAFDVQRPERRKTRLDVSDPQTLTNMELMEKYLAGRDMDDDERAAILKAAKKIMREVDDARLGAD